MDKDIGYRIMSSHRIKRDFALTIDPTCYRTDSLSPQIPNCREKPLTLLLIESGSVLMKTNLFAALMSNTVIYAILNIY